MLIQVHTNHISCVLFVLIWTIGLCTVNLSHAQQYDYSWQMGSYAGSGISMDFHTGQPVVSAVDRDINFITLSSSICNAEGELQFYTNGCQLFNGYHEFVSQVGDGNDFYYRNQCLPINPGYRIPAGAVMFPIDDLRYQMYHLNIMDGEYNGSYAIFSDVIYRTIMDSSLDGGHGRVISVNDTVLHHRIDLGYLASVQHANGEDWWMVVNKTNSDSFFVLHIDTSGVRATKVQSIGVHTFKEDNTIGASKFTPDGKKYLQYNLITGLQIFDFHRGTGTLSNAQHYPYWQTVEYDKVGGMAISPNSRYVYINNTHVLEQFDLEADDFFESRVFIDSFDGVWDPLPATFYQTQVAPDGKIYMSSTNSASSYHVVNNPNEKGLACNFVQRGFDLVDTLNIHWTMPYFPNYRLGADSSLLGQSHVDNTASVFPYELYPNPCRDALYFHLVKGVKLVSYSIVDVRGRQIVQDNLKERRFIDISSLQAGMYFLNLYDEHGYPFSKRFVKVE